MPERTQDQSESPKRILILGTNGQVGRELMRVFTAHPAEWQVTGTDRSRADLTNLPGLRQLVRELAPVAIVNAAAYTAVDRAEQQRELCETINATAPGVLAEEAARLGSLLVHYSTDYVFDGSKPAPWLETDATGPLNHYGATKLAGEEAIARVGGRFLILRTSWVYGPHGQNFLRTLLRLGAEREQLRVVDDQRGAPTTSMALAEATLAAVQTALCAGEQKSDPSGLYHMSCGGQTSWCGFARAIFEGARERLGRVPEVVGIPASEYPTPARRPAFSVLDNGKLAAKLGIRLPAWEQELHRTLRLLGLRA